MYLIWFIKSYSEMVFAMAALSLSGLPSVFDGDLDYNYIALSFFFVVLVR